MKTLLVLGGGPLQLAAPETARRMGLRVVVVDGNPNAPGLKLADRAYVADITNPEVCLEIARKENVAGVLHICSEVSMLVLGAINDALGLAGPGRKTALVSTNKAEMRRAFAAAGAPSPRSLSASTEAGAIEAASRLDGSIIVKPARNSGSRGVTRIEDASDRPSLLRAFHNALAESRDPAVVIEEFIEGPEFSVELVVWDRKPKVLAVTDKVTTGPPHFVETGHSQPSRFSPKERQLVEQAAVQGVMALGIDWSAAHAEIRLSERGPFIMEIGARLGGDYITTELVPRSTGIDMVQAAIELALGIAPALAAKHGPQGAAIRYLTPAPGRVTAITGVNEAKQVPGVRIVEVEAAVGDVVPELKSSLSRVGHVIAEGPDADAAIRSAEAARDMIRIVTVGGAALNG